MTSIFDLRITQDNVMPDGSDCGPDLVYTPMFIALFAAALGQEERQVGGSVLPAREPDWGEVFSQACSLLASTRDLRVLVITAQAATNRYGVPGWAQSVALIENWLARYWEDVHPRLELDGDFDPLLRANAVAALSDASGLLRQLRRAPFLATPVGPVSVADVERLLKGRDVNEGAPVSSLQELRAAIEKDSVASQTVIAHIQDASRSVAAIQQQFHSRLDSEFWPDLSHLVELLDGLLGVFPVSVSAPAVEVSQPQGELPPSQESALQRVKAEQAQVLVGLPSELRSVTDAFTALSLARQYFEKNEPSHPAPILISRIEKLKGKDFLSLVRELAPEGMQQLQAITGSHGAEESA